MVCPLRLHSLSVSHVNSLSRPTEFDRPTGRAQNKLALGAAFVYNARTARSLPPKCSLPGRTRTDSPGTYVQINRGLPARWRSGFPSSRRTVLWTAKKRVAPPKAAFCTKRLSRGTLGWVASGITFLSAFTVWPGESESWYVHKRPRPNHSGHKFCSPAFLYT